MQRYIKNVKKTSFSPDIFKFFYTWGFYNAIEQEAPNFQQYS